MANKKGLAKAFQGSKKRARTVAFLARQEKRDTINRRDFPVALLRLETRVAYVQATVEKEKGEQ